MCRGKFAPFFQEPCFRVETKISSTEQRRKPRVKITAPEDITISLSLAKSGFFNGNPETVLNTPVSLVLHTYYYEAYAQDYQDCYIELNKKEENKK